MRKQRIGEFETLRPCTARPDETALDAARRMVDQGVCMVAVVEGTAVVGTLTVRELVRRVVVEGKKAASTRLRDIMSANQATAGVGDDWHEVLRKMEQAGCCYLPVMDGGRVVATTSARVLLRHEVAEKEEDLRDVNERWDYLPPESGFGG